MKMQLINAEKISSMSRVYLDTSVTASNTGKRLLTVRSFFWPVGLGGAGFFGGYGRVTAKKPEISKSTFSARVQAVPGEFRENSGSKSYKFKQMQIRL